MAELGLRCCARALSSCGEWGPLCCGARASHCGGLPCCGARAPVVVAHMLGSCGLQAPERRPSSRGARAQLLRGMWDPPRPGLKPVSPALAGGLPTAVPPGKPKSYAVLFIAVYILVLELSLSHLLHSPWVT